MLLHVLRLSKILLDILCSKHRLEWMIEAGCIASSKPPLRPKRGSRYAEPSLVSQPAWNSWRFGDKASTNIDYILSAQCDTLRDDASNLLIVDPCKPHLDHATWGSEVCLWHLWQASPGQCVERLSLLPLCVWPNRRGICWGFTNSHNWHPPSSLCQPRGVPNHRKPCLQVLARAIQWLATVQTKALFQSPAKRSSGESQMMIVETAMRPKPSKTCVVMTVPVEYCDKLRWQVTWRCLSLRLKSTTKPCRTPKIVLVVFVCKWSV